MLVCVVVLDLEEATALVRWGYHFAFARSIALCIAYPKRAVDDKDSPLACAVRKTLEKLAAEHPKPCPRDDTEAAILPELVATTAILTARPQAKEVIDLVREQKAQLLIVGKTEGKSPRILANDLFLHAPCDTLLLRPGAGGDHGCKRVLIPTAGGVHAATALRWGHDVALRYDGELTPLFVENEFGPLAEAVGEHRLTGILAQIGLAKSAWVQPQVVVADDIQQGINAAAHAGCDLLLVGASDRGYVRRMLFSTLPHRLMAGPHAMAVGAMRRGKPLGTRIRDAVEDWLDLRIPQLERDERIELVEKLEDGARWSFDFMTLMCLSTAIAAFGLILDSTAVVIGAMLVAPLMTPLLAAGFGLVQGNGQLVRTAARSVAYGFMLALGIGVICALLTPTARLTGEMLGRGSPNIYDLMVAGISGLAAAFALSRPNLSAALPGVAIAAALVPPLATSGISLAYGEIANARGAALLFTTNVVAIVLAASAVFYARGVRGNRKSGTRRLWVRRLMLGLCLVGGVLMVPLSSVVFGEFRANRYQLSREQRALLQERLTAVGGRFLRSHGSDAGIELWIEAPRMLTGEEVAALRAELKERGRPVRVHTDLVIDVPAASD